MPRLRDNCQAESCPVGGRGRGGGADVLGALGGAVTLSSGASPQPAARAQAPTETRAKWGYAACGDLEPCLKSKCDLQTHYLGARSVAALIGSD